MLTKMTAKDASYMLPEKHLSIALAVFKIFRKNCFGRSFRPPPERCSFKWLYYQYPCKMFVSVLDSSCRLHFYSGGVESTSLTTNEKRDILHPDSVDVEKRLFWMPNWMTRLFNGKREIAGDVLLTGLWSFVNYHILYYDDMPMEWLACDIVWIGKWCFSMCVVNV